eukprot:scaffold61816_cov54-Attheya_sp.AAC.3
MQMGVFVCFVPGEIAHVPEGDGLVRSASGYEELVDRVKGEAIHVAVVHVFDHIDALVRVLFSNVPQAEGAVVADGTYQIRIALVPVHVLNHICMTLEGRDGLKLRPTLRTRFAGRDG